MSKPKYKLGRVVTGPGNISATIINILKGKKGYEYIVKPDGGNPKVWQESEIK